MDTWRRGLGWTTSFVAGAALIAGCSWWYTDIPPGDPGDDGPVQTASVLSPRTSSSVPPRPAASAASILAASSVVARLTRQGGSPAVRTSEWAPGGSRTTAGMTIQLVYRRDVRLVGVVPLVTPTGGTTYRVEKMRVDATARRFLLYVDTRSGVPKVVGITAGE